MPLNISGAVRIALLVIAVTVTFAIVRQQRTRTPPDSGRTLPPGYYLKSAVLGGTDESGRLLYTIATELAEERPDEDRILLTNVEVDYRPAAAVPWHVRSDNGVAQLDQSYIDLFGQVELISHPEPAATATIISTDSLRLKPDEFVAETPARVRVEMAGRQLRATGMVAYLKEDRLELQSNVNGQFRP